MFLSTKGVVSTVLIFCFNNIGIIERFFSNVIIYFIKCMECLSFGYGLFM